MQLRVLALLLAHVFAFSSGFGKSSALIVVGITTDEITAREFAEIAGRIQAALKSRGFEKADVVDQLDREAILERVASTAAGASSEGEFWLVLLGQSGRARDGSAAFQNRGKRLTAIDLRGALEKIPVPRVVFVGTNDSGSYLDALGMPGCDVITATARVDEQNQPRFPEFFSREMERDPTASLPELAARAVGSLKVALQNQGISLGEHAHLYDAVSGKVLTAPFGVTDRAAAPEAAATRVSGGTPVSANQIVIPKIESDEMFELQPATPETRALVESAAQVPNPDGYPAIIVQRDIEMIVNKDQSIRENVKARNYLVTRESFDQWANYFFPQDPPGEVTRVNAARLILPDGSSWVLNPTKLHESALGGVGSLIFPQAEPGSLVEMDYTTNRRVSFALPRFYLEKELAEAVPVKNLSIDLMLPKESTFHSYLKNIEAKPTTGETEHSQTLSWKFSEIAPYEPLPNDPPRREVVPWLGVSAFDSWDDFSGWFRRISEGAFDAGPRVKAKAAEIAASHKSRDERVRASYEYVTGLRYINAPCGLHAFRPRTPEQTLHNRYGDCKDKANLLVALLQEMKIDADFVLINRGSSTDPKFPGWQFNHAIAYLPPEDGKGDGLWLDSTDPSTPFGVVAPGNVYRSALVFENERANFKTVKPQEDSLGTIVETWTFEPAKTGMLRGRLKVVWGGILGHGPRSMFGDGSPLRRRMLVEGMMASQLPLTDYSRIASSDPHDLKTPMSLEADVSTEFPRWPGAPEELTAAFAAAERPRTMELNDGQPMRFQQVVKVPAAIAANAPPAPVEFVLPGQTFRIRYQPAGDAMERVAECEISNSKISAEDYPKVRAAMREWAQALETPAKPIP